MSRFLFALLLLATAVSVQAVTPARQDADGAGSTCPEAEQVAAAENAAAEQPQPPAPAKTTAPPAQAKETTPLPRPKSGARWHSFLPGMFK